MTKRERAKYNHMAKEIKRRLSLRRDLETLPTRQRAQVESILFEACERCYRLLFPWRSTRTITRKVTPIRTRRPNT